MPRQKLFDENEVLDKATHLFWSKGYHATSIQDLVDYLGINRASLYDTYGGKEQLFEKAFSRYCATTSVSITALLSKYNSVKQGIAKLLQETINTLLSDPETKGCFAVNATTELAPGQSCVINSLISNKDNFESILHNYFKQGQRNGELSKDKDTKALAAYFFTVFNGINVTAKLSKNKAELKGIVATALSVLE